MNERTKERGAARGVLMLAILASAAALLGLSFMRGEGLVLMLSRAITKFTIPMNSAIMFAFAVIIALVVSLFLHYYLFELKDDKVYDRARAAKVAQELHAVDRPPAERVTAARKMLEGDSTIFGHVLRRFLSENGFSAECPGKVWQGIQDEEFDRVKRNLMYFALASVLSPALGFLGTAVGMVAAFYEISTQDQVTPAMLATSIQIALITTVVGLVIKTVSMMLKTMLIHSIGRREDQVTVAYQQLIER